MDQKTIQRTNRLTGFIYLMLSVILIPISLSVFLSASGLIQVGAMIGVLIGVFYFIAFVKSLSFSKELQHPTGSTDISQEQVSWQVSTHDWSLFLHAERSRRTQGLLLESALIVILGSLILVFSRPVTFWMSLLFAVPIALIYYIVKFRTLISRLPKKDASVMILVTPVSIAFNTTVYPVNSSRFKVTSTDIKQAADGNTYLEVRYEWALRRGGYSHEEIRIPVPIHALEKADTASHLLKGYQQV